MFAGVLVDSRNVIHFAIVNGCSKICAGLFVSFFFFNDLTNSLRKMLFFSLKIYFIRFFPLLILCTFIFRVFFSRTFVSFCVCCSVFQYVFFFFISTLRFFHYTELFPLSLCNWIYSAQRNFFIKIILAKSFPGWFFCLWCCCWAKSGITWNLSSLVYVSTPAVNMCKSLLRIQDTWKETKTIRTTWNYFIKFFFE